MKQKLPKRRFLGIAALIGLAVLAFTTLGENEGYSSGAVRPDSDESNGGVREKPTVPAESDDLADPSHEGELADPTVRTKYVNSPDLPDGISFSALLMLLHGMRSDPDTAADWVAQRMGIEKSEAAIMVRRLEEVSDQFDAAFAKMRMDVLCEKGIPRIYGNDVFAALERVEDARDAIAEEHYLTFAAQLSESEAEALQRWVDAHKLRTVATRHNYKELYEKHAASADAVVARICLPTPGEEN